MSAVSVVVEGMLQLTASAMAFIVSSEISCYPAVVEDVEKGLVLVAKRAQRVILFLPEMQVCVVRKNIHSCVDGKLQLILRQSLHCL